MFVKNFSGNSICFDVHVTVHRDKFHIIKPTGCTYFSNLFWNETLHVLYSFSVHHQELFTVYTAMVYVSKPVWNITLLSVQRIIRDDGQRSCTKHVDFHSKINLRN